MSNDDLEWLERYSQSAPLRFPPEPQYGALSSSQGPSAPCSGFPPTSQTLTGGIRHIYPYNSPYAPPHTYVRPQDATYYSQSYHSTIYRAQQQYRANSTATAPPQPSGPTPVVAPAPPPSSTPSTAAQHLPTSAPKQPTYPPSCLNYPPFARATTNTDQNDREHDAKRRRVELPATVTVPKPTMAPPGSLSKYSFSPRNSTDRSHLRMRTDLAQPLNEADVAEKLQYDPKTIARDVLIASGRHPTESPLNHHLFCLRDVFAGLDTNSDLETFRWDLVDPQEKQVNNTKGTRDLLPTETRPAPSSLMSRTPAPQQSNHSYPHHPQQQRSQLPQTQTQTQKSQPQPPQKIPPQSLSQIHVKPPPQPQPQLQAQPPVPQVQLPSKSQPQPQPQTSQPQPPQKISPQSLSQIHVKPLPQPQPQSQPPVPQVQLPVKSQPQPNRRPHAHTTTKPQPPSQAKPPTRPSSIMVPKRAPASSKVEVTIPLSSQTPYQVYACDWENCQAELHNLEMLKKHIFKVHVSYALTCQWKGCKFLENLPAVHLYKHILKEHVESIAWKLGDGPSVPKTEGRDAGANPMPKTIPDSNQPGGEDSLVFPASYSSIRAFNRVHGKHTQFEKAREIFKAVQRVKEQVGFGLDPGGCELATPARNKRVSNDENFFAVRHES